jgi:8-oxo-dGTP pyrophosphatase MutT (NUDIX family)
VQHRVLSRIERLFWTYYDEVAGGDAAASRARLTQEFQHFASQVVSAIPTLLPTNGRPLIGVLRAFERAKQAAPRSYVVMLNKSLTQVVMVKQLHNSWWFLPGGKQEPQESARITAVREAFEETGLDVTPYLVAAEVVVKNAPRPIRVWFATNVPEDFSFSPQTVGEVADVSWRLLDSYADHQADPRHWIPRVLGLVRRVKDCVGRPRRLRRRWVELDTPDLTCWFDARQAPRDPFIAALYNFSTIKSPDASSPPDNLAFHRLAVTGVPPSADWRTLEAVMAPFGAIHTVHLPPHPATEPSLVVFRNRESCDAAILALSGKFVMPGCEAPLGITMWDNGVASFVAVPRDPNNDQSAGLQFVQSISEAAEDTVDEPTACVDAPSDESPVKPPKKKRRMAYLPSPRPPLFGPLRSKVYREYIQQSRQTKPKTHRA